MNLKKWAKNIIKAILYLRWIVLGGLSPIIYKIGLALVLFFVIMSVMFKIMGGPFHYDFQFFIIYWSVVLFEIVREQCFAFRWNMLKHPKSADCPECHQRVPLETTEKGRGFNNWGEIPGKFDWVVYFRRPRLRLHCPHCGTDKIVCPYCDKPVDEDAKRCPHCGKRLLTESKIFFPTPLDR